MTIANTFLGGASKTDAATRTTTEPRPLALQQEESGAPDFTSLLESAMGPQARREARERHDATVDRGRRAERVRAASRAADRAAERAAERSRAAGAERAAEGRDASVARSEESATGRADELRYGMLHDRRAESAAEPAAEGAGTEGASATGVGAPPQLQDTAQAGAAEDRSSAEGVAATQESGAQGEAQAAAQAEAARVAELSAAATLAAAASDPTRVVRDPNTLTPEFRERLERVIERMRSEFGHEVQIVEAARTPERQDFLYEQGRTRPGAVVTWTHASKHLDGRAADLMIDGSYADAQAFQRLQAIAAEEGLRTLGARDPGHVELAGGAPGAARGAAMLAALQAVATVDEVRVAPAASPDAVAQVAPVAQVATVAQVAPVAAVASVAVPGAAPRMAQAPVAQQGAQDAAKRELAQQAGDERAERRAARTEATAERSAERRAGERHEERADALAGLRQAAERAPQPSFGIEAPVPVMATDAASRISRVLELQDAAALPRPMSHMTLRVDNAGGGEDRIRVDLRGLGVGTNIDVTDTDTASRLGARVGDLQRALERHGLESESVRIGVRQADSTIDATRGAAAAAQIGDVARGADARGADAGASQQQSQQQDDSQRQRADDERRRATRDQDEAGGHAGESRHRSRREPHGERKR